MKFALFYEIPVPKPWGPDDERLAYEHTIEQAVAGERFGWDAFWTVEHHFLEEYSHCSNPEVLYGAIAAKTERIRLGYGVRLMPKPYNHPVRTAESVAVLDLISGGRVDFGTGRSSTRPELEGFGVDPKATREMWQEAIEHVVGCCIGLGCTRRSGIDQCLPSNEYRSLVQQPTMWPIASCHISRVSLGSTPKPSSSRRVDERPVPKSTRPPEMRSSTATLSAVRTGWLYGLGISRTPYPRRMRSVFAAMAP